MNEASLIARLGLDTSEFSMKLAQAVEETHGIHMAFRQLKILMEAGGVLTVAEHLFDAIVEHAKASKDATDENAAAVREFSEGMHGLKETALDVGVATLGTFNQIGSMIGDGIQRTGEWIGLWPESADAVEQTSESLRHVLANLKEAKVHAKEFQAITAELAKLEDERANLIFRELTPQERINQLSNELLMLEEKRASGFTDVLAMRENEVAIAKTETALLKENIEQEKTRREETIKGDKVSLEARLAHMSIAQKISALTEEIASGEAIIRAGATKQKDLAVITAELEDRKLQLQKAQGEQQKENQTLRQKAALSLESELELFELQRKRLTGLNESEKAKYDLLVLQKKERLQHIEIEDLEQKLIAGTITTAERNRLDQLIKQHAKLEDQITSQKELIANAPVQADAEKPVTEELEKQAVAAGRTLKAKKDMVQVSGSPLGLRNLGSMSSDALEAEAAQLKKLLDDLRARFQPSFSTPNVEGDFGYAITSSQLSSVKDELALRSKIQGAYQHGGRAGALDEFVRGGGDALSFDTMFTQMSNWSANSQQTNQQLGQVHSTLNSIDQRLSIILPHG